MSCNPFNPKLAEWDRDFQRPIIAAKDAHSAPSYKATNPSAKHFNLFKVDDNLIDTSARAKCDFLLIEFQRHQDKGKDCVPLHAYFIELKGSDIERANEQILQSITELYPMINSSIPHTRIVLNRINTLSINSNGERKLKAYVRQKGGTHKQVIFNNNRTPEIL